ncbi:Hypothetical Protein RRSL_02294 [Ralstonia solanacearum UW551]|uniref:Uncharacterized protein n=1 Tax=Ralstonia solanacearum (strain UW551) TaxID=342110 RepID=A0AB33VE29_RALSU|nr:Hypothetical Protein RRSL_02294 [Ralstonia solanacearum UW551]
MAAQSGVRPVDAGHRLATRARTAAMQARLASPYPIRPRSPSPFPSRAALPCCPLAVSALYVANWERQRERI